MLLAVMELSKRPVEFSCLRCKMSVPSVNAWQQHIIESVDHNLCPICEYKKDFESFSQLQDHLDRDHLYCEPCHWFAPSAIGLTQHNVSKHSMCCVCKEFFMSPNELNGHALIHRPKSASCFLCGKEYPTMSAAFNHLESGNCEAGVTQLDIRNLAVEYWRRVATQGINTTGNVFRCSACQRSYLRLSDHLQHVETRACQEGYWKGSGNTGNMVTFIMEGLKVLVDARQNRARGRTLKALPGPSPLTSCL